MNDSNKRVLVGGLVGVVVVLMVGVGFLMFNSDGGSDGASTVVEKSGSRPSGFKEKIDKVRYKLRLKKEEKPTILKDGVVARAVSWDPRMADLKYRLSNGEEKVYRIFLLKTAVIIMRGGEKELVMSIQKPRWTNLFCPGDKLEIDYKDDGSPKTIINVGPRECAVR